jgi:hypothetical protein
MSKPDLDQKYTEVEKECLISSRLFPLLVVALGGEMSGG